MQQLEELLTDCAGRTDDAYSICHGRKRMTDTR